jgi:hypothetical protein
MTLWCSGLCSTVLCCVGLAAVIEANDGSSPPAEATGEPATQLSTADNRPLDQPQLNARIEQLLSQNPLGPPAGPTDPATLCRRTYLALVGILPDRQQLKAFLEDSGEDRHERLVDELISSEAFNLYWSVQLDWLWMERRPNTHVPQADWLVFLERAVADDQPLTELIRQLLTATGEAPQPRAAARFFLDREGDPNAIARDVGRIFLGRDLQCAQCHDHPSIEDYLQQDYQGLLAAYLGGQLKEIEVEGSDSKLTVYTEQPAGDVTFESVFDRGNSRRIWPRVPGGYELLPPELMARQPNGIPTVSVATDRSAAEAASGAASGPGPSQTVVAIGGSAASEGTAANEGAAGGNATSRRAQVALQLTGGEHPYFNRNLANQLIGLVLGHAPVEPVDFHHSGNPAAQLGILELMTDQLVADQFRLKRFLRRLVLSPLFSVELGDDARLRQAMAEWRNSDAANLGSDQLSELLTRVDRQLAAATLRLDQDRQLALQLEGVRLSSLERLDQLRTAEQAASQQLAQATANHQTASDAAEQLRVAFELHSGLQAGLESVAAATAEDDQELRSAVAVLQQRRERAATEWELQQSALVAAARERDEAQQTWDVAAGDVRHIEEQLAALQIAYQTLDRHWTDSRLRVEWLETERQWLRQLTKVLEPFHRLVSTEAVPAATEPEDENRAVSPTSITAIGESDWRALQTWRDRLGLQWAPKPLNPYQLGWSTLHLTGLIDSTRQSKASELEQAGEVDQEKLEAATRAALQPIIDQHYVRLFGSEVSQPQVAFFASSDQALFAANGHWLNTGVAPRTGNLTEQAVPLWEQPKELATLVFEWLLSRTPSEEEVDLVAEQLAGVETAAEATERVKELVWSLLAGLEFRFCR